MEISSTRYIAPSTSHVDPDAPAVMRLEGRGRGEEGERKREIRRGSSLLAAPTKPENLTSREITGTTIRLSWSEPENANGLIAGYRVYYMYSNYTDVKMHIPNKTVSSDEPPSINFILKELREYASRASGVRRRLPPRGFSTRQRGEGDSRFVAIDDPAALSPLFPSARITREMFTVRQEELLRSPFSLFGQL